MSVYPWFAALGPFEQVPYDEALERYEFDDEIGDAFGDFFADDVHQVYVHTGSSHIPQHLDVVSIWNEPPHCGGDLYVLDGDLTVDGVLRIRESEQGALVVTGDLEVAHLVVEGDAQLHVLGSLFVGGVLVCDFSQTGTIHVDGPVTVQAWIALDDWGWPDFNEPPHHPHDPARRVDLTAEKTTDILLPDVLDETGATPDREKLLAALKADRRVLAVPEPITELPNE